MSHARTSYALLNEVLSLNAQESPSSRKGTAHASTVLNEVLSLNAQEWLSVKHGITSTGLSSMKS